MRSTPADFLCKCLDGRVFLLRSFHILVDVRGVSELQYSFHVLADVRGVAHLEGVKKKAGCFSFSMKWRVLKRLD
jgi:hypothetical protein